MVRAFVALEISQEIREALAEAQDVLKRCLARLTFVSPPQIHVTIKFLGEIDDALLQDVAGALCSVRVPPFSVLAGRVAVNNPRRPFTVWCVIGDGGNGAVLRDLVDNALAPLGIAREHRPFTAHATIARVKRYDPSLMESLRQLGRERYGECMITGMKLKKSTLAPAGPVYEDIAEVRW